MPAIVVSIINLKGGVGKSTLTMMIGEFLAFRYAQKVLLIDMDAQANLSYCMVPDAQIGIQEREGENDLPYFPTGLPGRRVRHWRFHYTASFSGVQCLKKWYASIWD